MRGPCRIHLPARFRGYMSDILDECAAEELSYLDAMARTYGDGHTSGQERGGPNLDSPVEHMERPSKRL